MTPVNEIFGLPKREECPYTQYYCEENIWQLCNLIVRSDEKILDQFHVIFISNESKTVPLWKQRARAQAFVIWDYHVILLRKSASGCLVFDLDTTLPFPCPFEEYFAAAIGNEDNFKPEFRRQFRIIPAADYLHLFSSDRHHMRDKNGQWLQPPPPWPPIGEPPSTLHYFWSMTGNDFLENASQILDASSLYKTFSSCTKHSN